MTYEIGRRDANGILFGSLEQGGWSWPIDILSHIVPFLYPCENCQKITFHVVGEQHAGIGIKIPFTRRPLATIGKGYHLICNTCTYISSHIPKDVFRKLEQGILDQQITNVYLEVCDSPEPYTEEYTQLFIDRHPGIGEKEKALVRQCISAYKREVPQIYD